jgi:predicted ATPase
VTDNVVELMARTIAKFDEQVRDVLKSAACVGGRFDLGILCAVNEQAPQTILSDLWTAVEAGLVSTQPGTRLRVVPAPDGTTTVPGINAGEALDKIGFRFVHDRVHEAAYGLMDAGQKMGTHLRIGRLMLEKCDPRELTENIFDIVSQLNHAVALITEPDEIVALADLNLKAGQRARSLALFESAFEYFRVGIELTTAKGWQHQYELTKELYLKGIEAAYLSGRYGEMDHWFETAVHHIRSPIEVADAYVGKIEKENTTANFSNAIDVGIEILARLDVNLPADPSEADVRAELEKTEKLLSGFTTDDIMSLPEMEDPRHLAALQLLFAVGRPAFYVNRELVGIIVLKRLSLLLHHGNSEYSAYIFNSYAFMLAAIPEKIREAHHFGQLSIRLLDRYENPRYNTHIRSMFYGFILPFAEHTRKSIKALEPLHHEAMEIGDFFSAGNSLFLAAAFRFFTGKPLESVKDHMAQCRRVLIKNRIMHHVLNLDPHHQMVLNLMGRSKHRQALIGEAFDEDVHLPRIQKEGNQTTVVAVYFCKLMLAYLKAFRRLSLWRKRSRAPGIISSIWPPISLDILSTPPLPGWPRVRPTPNRRTTLSLSR